MTIEKWILDDIESLLIKSNDYREKALLLATKNLVLEQAIRIEQLEGQLDGMLWSPREWEK